MTDWPRVTSNAPSLPATCAQSLRLASAPAENHLRVAGYLCHTAMAQQHDHAQRIADVDALLETEACRPSVANQPGAPAADVAALARELAEHSEALRRTEAKLNEVLNKLEGSIAGDPRG